MSQHEVIAYIALGSNLDNPIKQVSVALNELNEIDKTHVLQLSSLYKTSPMGVTDQDNFINAVAEVATFLSAQQLLTQLNTIEAMHKSQRPKRWGPRTLDLDLLLYGDETFDSEYLMVPHPGLLKRDFVLVPLLEIAPEIKLPNGELIAPYLKNIKERFIIEPNG